MKKKKLLFMWIMASLYAEDKQKNSIVKQIPVSTKNSSLEPVDSVAVVIYTDMDPLVLTKVNLIVFSINGQKQDPKRSSITTYYGV